MNAVNRAWPMSQDKLRQIPKTNLNPTQYTRKHNNLTGIGRYLHAAGASKHGYTKPSHHLVDPGLHLRQMRQSRRRNGFHLRQLRFRFTPRLLLYGSQRRLLPLVHFIQLLLLLLLQRILRRIISVINLNFRGGNNQSTGTLPSGLYPVGRTTYYTGPP